MPMRSGPSRRREDNPRIFRQNVWITVLFGGARIGILSWGVPSQDSRIRGSMPFLPRERPGHGQQWPSCRQR